MDIRRRTKQLSGAIVLLVGCVLTLASLRRLPYISHVWTTGNLAMSLWNITGFVVFPALAAYCVLSGLRLINPQLIRAPRFGWGRIVIGSFMLYVQVGSDLHFTPEGPVPTFKASNPTQAATMKATGIAIGLFFIYLIYRGVRAGFTRPKPRQEIQVQAAEPSQ